MNISDKSRKAMESLGLTGYEIKAYIALAEAGTSTASDLSKKSGVPYSKIYEVLNGLEEKGWSESDSSRPQKFFPRSPRTALEAMRMRIENGIKDNESLIVSELMPVYEKISKASPSQITAVPETAKPVVESTVIVTEAEVIPATSLMAVSEASV